MLSLVVQATHLSGSVLGECPWHDEDYFIVMMVGGFCTSIKILVGGTHVLKMSSSRVWHALACGQTECTQAPLTNYVAVELRIRFPNVAVKLIYFLTMRTYISRKEIWTHRNITSEKSGYICTRGTHVCTYIPCTSYAYTYYIHHTYYISTTRSPLL